MRTPYLAYGLQLLSTFPLVGMKPDSAEGLPSLSLELQTDGQLTANWSGPDGPPVWRGRLGDGHDLTIERGVAEDLLFAYGDRARFHLHASGQALACAPREQGLDWQRALLSKVLSSVSVMRGYEALHASAVDSPQGVVAVLAPSGAGKTTLAIELMRRGWPLFADDVLTLSRGAGESPLHEAPDGSGGSDGPGGIRAYPGTPHMNVAESETASAEIGASLGVLAGEQWIVAHATARKPRPVRMLCLLSREAGLTLRAQTLSPNPLLLAPYMLGLLGDIERERRRFALYADLMGSATLLLVSGDHDDRPEDLADLIERALEEYPSALAVGGAR
jgi:hypothetical protein